MQIGMSVIAPSRFLLWLDQTIERGFQSGPELTADSGAPRASPIFTPLGDPNPVQASHPGPAE